MIPVLFHLGPVTIYSYGAMLALAFIVSDFLVAHEFKRKGYNPEPVSMLVLWVAVAAMVGSRLYDIFDNWSYYWAQPSRMVLSGSGFTFYGGLICALILTAILARYYKLRWLALADMSAPALALGYAIGRMGCQLAGDGDWGMVSNLPWAMAYPRAIVGWNGETVLKLDDHNHLVSAFFPGVRVHPAPFYETILGTVVFLILWRFRDRLKIEGRLFYLYLILAGLSRFAVEFVRINPRVVWGLSEAQLIALFMIVIGTLAFSASGLKQPITAARNAA